MASNGRSGLHVDAYQSDVYTVAGPLGHSPEVSSTFKATASSIGNRVVCSEVICTWGLSDTFNSLIATDTTRNRSCCAGV